MLTVVDACTRECPTPSVDYALPSGQGIGALERAIVTRGRPVRVVCDHGAEFSSLAFLSWARAAGDTLDFVRSGKPVDNAFIESLNGKLRDECLNEQYSVTLDDARQTIERWRQHYNRARPHSSLGRMPPATYAARFTSDPKQVVLKTG